MFTDEGCSNPHVSHVVVRDEDLLVNNRRDGADVIQSEHAVVVSDGVEAHGPMSTPTGFNVVNKGTQVVSTSCHEQVVTNQQPIVTEWTDEDGDINLVTRVDSNVHDMPMQNTKVVSANVGTTALKVTPSEVGNKNGINQVVLDDCKMFEEAMQDVANKNAENASNSGFNVYASDNVPKTTNIGEMGSTSFANVLRPKHVTRKVNF